MQQHRDGIDHLFDSTFRSCPASLDSQEAWNLQVMQCMISFWIQKLIMQYMTCTWRHVFGISRWCRACRTCRQIRPFGCTICGAGCNFSIAQFLKSFRTKQATFTDSLRKIFQKTTENARSWCFCQVLGSWGSRLHVNGEPWYRLRTLHHSLDGRGGRNPGASGATAGTGEWITIPVVTVVGRAPTLSDS